MWPEMSPVETAFTLERAYRLPIGCLGNGTWNLQTPCQALPTPLCIRPPASTKRRDASLDSRAPAAAVKSLWWVTLWSHQKLIGSAPHSIHDSYMGLHGHMQTQLMVVTTSRGTCRKIQPCTKLKQLLQSNPQISQRFDTPSRS